MTKGGPGMFDNSGMNNVCEMTNAEEWSIAGEGICAARELLKVEKWLRAIE
jgi:hypothetical protein